MFLQHKGFRSELVFTAVWEKSRQYKPKDVLEKPELFKFVAFQGHGWLNKHGYEGDGPTWRTASAACGSVSRCWN